MDSGTLTLYSAFLIITILVLAFYYAMYILTLLTPVFYHPMTKKYNVPNIAIGLGAFVLTAASWFVMFKLTNKCANDPECRNKLWS